MKRRTLYAACTAPVLGLCILWSITALADEPASPDRPPDVADLREEIAALKAHVERLEQRIDELSQQKQPVQILWRQGKAVEPPQRGREVPEDWTPREFNGMRYYIVPLKSSERKF